MLPAPSEPNNIPTASPRSGLHLDLLSGEEFGTASTENSLALVPAAETTVPSAASEQNMLVLSGVYSSGNNGDSYNADIAFSAEQAYAVGYKYQQQKQEALPYLDGSAINYGHSIYEQASIVQGVERGLGDPLWNDHIADTQQRERLGMFASSSLLYMY